MQRSQYLNTDLCLISSAEPVGLCKALANCVEVMHESREADGSWYVCICASESGARGREAAQDIASMLEAIEGLAPEMRAVWDACEGREFNVGWQAADKRPEGAFKLPASLVDRLAAVGASLGVTIYPSSENDLN